MKVQVVPITKEKREYNDLILHYGKYIGRLYSGKTTCMKDEGYWVEFNGNSKCGSFYSAEQIEKEQQIELHIEGKLLTGRPLAKWLQLHFINEINIDTDVEAEFDGDVVSEISFPVSLLITPYVNMQIDDMYMGGIGELEHIGVSGKVIFVQDEYFIVKADYANVPDVKVDKSSWHWLSLLPMD